MPVNWTQFEQRLTDYFESKSAKNEDDAAKFIVDMYDAAIRGGAKDIMFQNIVLQVNKQVFLNAVKSAFKLAKISIAKKNSDRVIRTLFNSGLIGYWTGATLGLTTPPPGTVGIVSNIVTFPGLPPNVSVENTDDPKKLAKELSTKFRVHLLSIKGITTALVPAPPGAPIPTPFPFGGIS